MISDHGHGGFKEQKYLTIDEIEQMTTSEDSVLSTTAKSLIQAVENNRNHLLDDEAELPKKFGIEMDVKPRFVRYYENSGRVSVYWEAHTKNLDDAFRWGIVAPPNDARKQDAIRNWFERKPENLERICRELRDEGHKFDKWWE